MARPAKEKAIAPAVMDMGDLVRKRDAFVTSMAHLRNAADEASRSGIAFFDLFIGASSDDQARALFQRGLTEEPEGPKKRAKRAKRDPDMPKRPMTAYLLFCHEGRETVKSDLGSTATHKEVIAELTKRWTETPEDEKKLWQDLYQKNREVYEKDMAQYRAAKGPVPGGASTSFTAVNTELDALPGSDVGHETPVEEHAESEVEAEAEPQEEDEEEEEEEEDEDEEDEEEEVEKSPTPPPRKKTTPRGKKAAVTATNGNVKKTSITTASPPLPVKEEPVKRKRAARKKVVENEVSEEVSPKKKPARKRRKGSD